MHVKCTFIIINIRLGGHWAGGTKLEAHGLKSVTVYWAGGT